MKFIIALIIIAALVAGGYYGIRLLKDELRTNLELNTKFSRIVDSVAGARQSLTNVVTDTVDTVKKKRISLETFKTLVTPKKTEVEAVTLYMKHGGVINAKLLDESADGYTVEWDGNEFFVETEKVLRVERKTQKDIEWAYENDVVIQRTNGTVLDARIADVGPDTVTLLYVDDEGGQVETGIPRGDIEYLMFAPVCNVESEEIEKALKKQLPKMQFYREGNVTLVTDSYATWVDRYHNAIRTQGTDVYLEFFRLFKDKKQLTQHFIIVFDNIVDYADYALSDGVPFYMVLGYFSPTDKALVLFNSFGEAIQEMIFSFLKTMTGFVDVMVDRVKERVDDRYDIFIEGQSKEFKDRFWKMYNLYKNELVDQTLSVLRHEYTHEIFHNWGLQSIIVSTTNIDRKELADKKKEFLDTDDPQKKRELFDHLIALRKEESEALQMDAANSWLAEGIATYCETYPIGSRNDLWLYLYQEMVRKNEVNPIEFITYFKMGSFPGLCPKAQLNAYAQSWALATFLMKKYPRQFIDFQKKLSLKAPEGDEELNWLLVSTGKDLPTLQKEFEDFMAAYAALDDPDVARYTKMHDIFND